MIRNSQQASFPLPKYFFSKLLHSDLPAPTHDDLADVMPFQGYSMKSLTEDNVYDSDIYFSITLTFSNGVQITKELVQCDLILHPVPF